MSSEAWGKAERVVAIHQPNFLPWLGYFDKIAGADVFVVLDTVQFPKTGGTWMNRVQVLVGGRPDWITVPIVRSYHGVRQVNEIQINSATPWRGKLLRAIEISYKRAPFYAQIFPLIESLVKYPVDNLAQYNLNALHVVLSNLGLDATKLVLASTLAASGSATDLLISLVNALDGSAYICGGGAAGYQEDDKFAAAGLKLIYQDFRHPVYPQFSSTNFAPGLSIVDALMNCGLAATARLLRPRQVLSQQ